MIANKQRHTMDYNTTDIHQDDLREHDTFNRTAPERHDHDDFDSIHDTDTTDPVQRAVRSLLVALGENPDREGLVETPRRVAKMYRELFAGVSIDPAVYLQRVFNEEYDEIVLLRDIQFHSLCEHHLLPFSGKAHVGYLPDGNVVGLSKLARTVEAFARRPQVQERMTNQIADAMVEHLSARGVVVILEAEHLCMRMRGVQQPNSTMITSAMRGVFKDDLAARSEVMSLIRNGA